MTYHVETRDLCKEYSGKKALVDISLNVERGEILALIGPNGSGKTTLLRVLDLLDTPTSGTVWLEGTQVDYSAKDRQTTRRKIGMVFQRTVLFNMSVYENVAYGLKIKGEHEKNVEPKVRNMLELVQLHGFERRNALALSGGEAQRVALAQALVAEPNLLLLDEPTANLDPRNTSIVEEVLSRVNREKKTTMIMSTHNMGQAENVAHRVAVLNEGRVERIGGLQEIFEKPFKFLEDFARLENVLSGVSNTSPEGTSVIDLGEGFLIEAAFTKEGQVTVHVPPEDILLSTQRLFSSARNTFEGRIVQISEQGPIVKVKVRAGKDFAVQITRRSFNDMRLNLDSKVIVTFKASSVRMV